MLSRITFLLSSACIVHCLLTPFVILLLPAFATFFNSTVESVLVFSVVPLSAVGFLPTWRKHRNNRLLTVYLVSLAVMLGTHLLFHYVLPLDGASLHVHDHGGIPHDHGDHAHSSFGFLETALMIGGALGLAWATWKNNRHTHVCKTPGHVH